MILNYSNVPRRAEIRFADLLIQLFDFQREDLSQPSWSFVGPTVCPLAHVSVFGCC